jgi:hypothetical protein
LPIPQSLGYGARVFAPGEHVRKVAWCICDLAWRVRAASVYRWPCGTVVVATASSRVDERLAQQCGEHLFGVYSRPLMTTVMRDLADAEVSA